jgi:hypothetical protein
MLLRRILLYTKAQHANKSFFAIFRGIFPIQELCGTLTALALAKRDLLGFYTPLWQVLGPAVVLHGMANYRGMKVRANAEMPGLRRFSRVLTFFASNHSQYLSGTPPHLGLRCNSTH